MRGQNNNPKSKRSMKLDFIPVRPLLLLGLFSAVLVTAQAADLSGLKVGEDAPAFVLKNQDGELVQFEELLKKSPVAVVFFRSADW